LDTGIITFARSFARKKPHPVNEQVPWAVFFLVRRPFLFPAPFATGPQDLEIGFVSQEPPKATITLSPYAQHIYIYLDFLKLALFFHFLLATETAEKDGFV